MEQTKPSGYKFGELLKCLLYAVIINTMGSFGYWFAYVIKDMLKCSFQIEFEAEITTNITLINQWFLAGELLSGLAWTYLLKYISIKFCILISLGM